MSMNLDDVLKNTGPDSNVLSEQHINFGADGTGGLGECANIAYANGKSSIMVAEKPAWHKAGVVAREAPDAAGALAMSNMDRQIDKVRNHYLYKGTWIPDETYAVVFADSGERIATCSDQFQIVQNRDAFAFMDSLVEGGFKYESAGALGKGERVWILARLPEAKDNVAGDEVQNFACFMNSHKPGESLKVFLTRVRIVCQNTYNMARAGFSRGGLRIRHDGSLFKKLEEAQKALGLLVKDMERHNEQCEWLAKTQLEPQEYFRSVLDQALDVTVAGQKVTEAAIKGGSILDAIDAMTDVEKQCTEEDRFNRAMARRRVLLEDAMERYDSERNGGNPALAGTGYAAWNTVTEAVDHGELAGRGSTIGGELAQARRKMGSVLLGKGDEIKRDALKLALQQTGWSPTAQAV